MTDKQKDNIVEDLIQGFDFEKVHSIMYLTKRNIHDVPTIYELKKQADKLIRMTFEHQDREFWWAGTHGLFASFDDRWGLSLRYCPMWKRERFPQRDIEKGDKA